MGKGLIKLSHENMLKFEVNISKPPFSIKQCSFIWFRNLDSTIEIAEMLFLR